MKSGRFKEELRKIRAMEEEFRALSDEELQAKTAEFKTRYQGGESLDSLMCEAFAACIEADDRILGKRPFDVQILGAIGLHKGLLVEMNTGEGKTLTATMPLYLNALSGKSCILVTANEYLAYRDAMEMGVVYQFMGLTVRAGVRGDSEEPIENDEKKEIYEADIVYTTHGTLGFDYLFNNLVSCKEERFLREFNYAIIDEADMVLLDAAQMPLIISGAPRVQSNLYETADFFVTTLRENVDYEIEDQAIWLTKEGVRYAEEFFGIDHYYSAKNFELNRHITLALRAHGLFEEGKEYIVSENNEIVLMDQAAGRAAPGMKLNGGQHQAIEAREHVEITQENRSVASITYQNFFPLFPRLAGMSATIADAKRELKKIYRKDIMIIPPNRPLIRVDQKDRYFQSYEEQNAAALKDVIERHEKGQPVLVVTSTIEDTELISRQLVDQHISHNVLNANNAYWEAQIIKEAGQRNAVTVSTGMAGRGTDIRLGKGVQELGGLAIIGIGRMSNIRLERQVRGRSGRQGDPGVSQFYVSLEDEVVTRSLGEEKAEHLLDKKKISTLRLRRIINGARWLDEDRGFSDRKRAMEYDKVVKFQRNIFYEARNRLLDGETPNIELIKKAAEEGIRRFLREQKTLTRHEVNRYVLDCLSYKLDSEELPFEEADRSSIQASLIRYASLLIDRRTEALEKTGELAQAVRLCMLRAMDTAWVEEVDYLQQLQYVMSGRQTAQKNPVFEYQNEAYESFQLMQIQIKKDLVRNFLLGEVSYDKEKKMVIIFP